MPDPDPDATDRLHRTTLYIPAALAVAIRTLAARRRCSVNALVVEAIEALVAAYDGGGSSAVHGLATGESGVDATLALRREMASLAERLTRLEAYVHGRASVAVADGKRQILDAAGVRREAQALIEERGSPISHRELLGLLQQKFVLPGRNPSENLRTILVHPKAKGFKFLRGEGYFTS